MMIMETIQYQLQKSLTASTRAFRLI